MSRTILVLLFLLTFSFACKKTTTYQIVLYNGSDEQLKVKVYSRLALKSDSFMVNSLSEFEVFFKEEDGINANYDCTATIDSVFTYSASHKMKIKVNKSSSWEYYPTMDNSKEEHRCTLAIGKGDTIK